MAQTRGLRQAVLWAALFGLLVSLVAFLFVMEGRRSRAARRREAEESRPTTLTSAEVQPESVAPNTGAAPPACTAHVDCARGALCTRGRCATITPRTTECREVMIRFASGAADLSSLAEVEVERTARCIEAGREPTVEIEPSTDSARSAGDNERVTNAREAAVRRALEQRAVSPERLRALRLERSRQ